jgi:hypothetical protein
MRCILPHPTTDPWARNHNRKGETIVRKIALLTVLLALLATVSYTSNQTQAAAGKNFKPAAATTCGASILGHTVGGDHVNCSDDGVIIWNPGDHTCSVCFFDPDTGGYKCPICGAPVIYGHVTAGGH